MAINYIHRLQGVQRDAHSLGEQALSELDELVGYLMSSKFHSDTTVQVQDILNRLAPARSTLVDLCYVTRPDNNRTRPQIIYKNNTIYYGAYGTNRFWAEVGNSGTLIRETRASAIEAAKSFVNELAKTRPPFNEQVRTLFGLDQ